MARVNCLVLIMGGFLKVTMNSDNGWHVTMIFFNAIGPRILLKHAFLFPGFLANFERFYLFVSKNS